MAHAPKKSKVSGVEVMWRRVVRGNITGFVRGDAPRVVLVHGFAGAPWDWCRILTRLGPEVPVALIEVPGHGPQGRAPHKSWASVSEGLLNWLTDAKLAVGYSLGGRLLVGALAMRDTALSSLILGGHAGLNVDSRPARKVWDLEQATLLQQESMTQFRQRWGALPLLQRVHPDTDAETARLERGRGKLTTNGLSWAMTELGSGSMPDVLDALVTRNHRLIWAYGDRDTKYRDLAHHLAQQHTQWKHYEITSSGHACHLDAPDQIASLLRSLLREDDSLERCP